MERKICMHLGTSLSHLGVYHYRLCMALMECGVTGGCLSRALEIDPTLIQVLTPISEFF